MLIPTWVEEMKQSYDQGPSLQEVSTQLEADPTRLLEPHWSRHQGLLRYKGGLYAGFSQGWREKLMKDNQEFLEPIKGTYQRVTSLFYWPNLI